MANSIYTFYEFTAGGGGVGGRGVDRGGGGRVVGGRDIRQVTLAPWYTCWEYLMRQMFAAPCGIKWCGGGSGGGEMR